MEIVYLETTFFSFYHDERPAPAIVAMRDWTRQRCDGSARAPKEMKRAMVKQNLTGAPGTKEVTKQITRWRKQLS